MTMTMRWLGALLFLSVSVASHGMQQCPDSVKAYFKKNYPNDLGTEDIGVLYRKLSKEEKKQVAVCAQYNLKKKAAPGSQKAKELETMADMFSQKIKEIKAEQAPTLLSPPTDDEDEDEYFDVLGDEDFLGLDDTIGLDEDFGKEETEKIESHKDDTAKTILLEPNASSKIEKQDESDVDSRIPEAPVDRVDTVSKKDTDVFGDFEKVDEAKDDESSILGGDGKQTKSDGEPEKIELKEPKINDHKPEQPKNQGAAQVDVPLEEPQPNELVPDNAAKNLSVRAFRAKAGFFVAGIAAGMMGLWHLYTSTRYKQMRELTRIQDSCHGVMEELLEGYVDQGPVEITEYNLRSLDTNMKDQLEDVLGEYNTMVARVSRLLEANQKSPMTQEMVAEIKKLQQKYHLCVAVIDACKENVANNPGTVDTLWATMLGAWGRLTTAISTNKEGLDQQRTGE